MTAWGISQHGAALGFLAIASLLIGVAESANPESLAAGPRNRPERRRHLMWMAAYVVYAPVLGLVAVLLIEATSANASLGQVQVWPFVARVAVALLTVEAVFYCLHRAKHRSRGWLWKLHRVHHRATEVRWWTTTRFHPLDAAIDLVVPYVVAASLGVGTDSLLVVSTVVTVVTVVAHADLAVPNRALDRIVVTPRFHRTHHEAGHSRSNFALMLPLADLLGGTATLEVTLPRRFGLDSGKDQDPNRERNNVGEGGGETANERVVVSAGDNR